MADAVDKRPERHWIIVGTMHGFYICEGLRTESGEYKEITDSYHIGITDPAGICSTLRGKTTGGLFCRELTDQELLDLVKLQVTCLRNWLACYRHEHRRRGQR